MRVIFLRDSDSKETHPVTASNTLLHRIYMVGVNGLTDYWRCRKRQIPYKIRLDMRIIARSRILPSWTYFCPWQTIPHGDIPSVKFHGDKPWRMTQKVLTSAILQYSLILRLEIQLMERLVVLSEVLWLVLVLPILEDITRTETKSKFRVTIRVGWIREGQDPTAVGKNLASLPGVSDEIYLGVMPTGYFVYFLGTGEVVKCTRILSTSSPHEAIHFMNDSYIKELNELKAQMRENSWR